MKTFGLSTAAAKTVITNFIKRIEGRVDSDPVPTDRRKWAQPGHFSRSLSKGPATTTWVWNLHADAHDFDTHTYDRQLLLRQVFGAHFGQLGIILIWLSGAHFHGACFSNYDAWMSDPTHIKPTAQKVWAVLGQEVLNGDMGGGTIGVQRTSGLFQLWRARGLVHRQQLYVISYGILVLALLFFVAGWFHFHSRAPKLVWFQNSESILNHHLAGILGLGSLSWAGHQIHVSAPINNILDAGIDINDIPRPLIFLSDQRMIRSLYPSFAKGLVPFFTLNWGAYSDFLTFQGGLNPVTGGLWITDEAHHHLAISVLFILAGHLYRTNFGIGLRIEDILDRHSGPLTGEGHKGLYTFLTCSLHAQLALNLAILGSISIIVAHHIYAIPPYPYLATDYRTSLSLFTHHIWIGGFCIVGAGAHAAVFIVRDYELGAAYPIGSRGASYERRSSLGYNNRYYYNNVLDRVIRHRDAIISHLNWVSIFLGFHRFGLYIHNDTISSLGRPQDIFSDNAIQIQPVFAHVIQKLHVMAPQRTAPMATYATSPTWGGDLVVVGNKIALIPVSLGTADFMVHHIHAFTIHVTALILLKGVLYARSSRLIPDKANLGFRFPCDGPGRGGTCQVSAWDHVFLGLFWMYNSLSIVIFHFIWKIQSDVWGVVTKIGVSHITGGNFSQSANTINGWLRDFLWAQSSQVIQSYGSALSAYGLIFLGAHFVWAFSLIFLFSGRGYWQELIESILWAHSKLKVAPTLPPRALSITHGRAVGVAHYLLGGIATTWSFFLARIISVGSSIIV
jgi:photosystem I P700 chlorophyll a apoprotein A1